MSSDADTPHPDHHPAAGRSPSRLLRRKRGSEDMSLRGSATGGLRVVNVSPESEDEEEQEVIESPATGRGDVELGTSKEPLLDPDEGLLDSPFSSPAEAFRYSSPVYRMSGSSAPRVSSPEAPSLFDVAEEEGETEPTTATTRTRTTVPTEVEADDDGGDEYDLKPPPKPLGKGKRYDRPKGEVLEAATAKFFSKAHLNFLLRNHRHATRFRKFLETYQPHHSAALKSYSERVKAEVALEYANALVGSQVYPREFEAVRLESDNGGEALGGLVEEALPAYLTQRLVELVTDTLVKEITGNGAPVVRELIGSSLAETFCISTNDPEDDNPIVYASEGFYSTTQYEPEEVIGRNCRFLQETPPNLTSRTSPVAVKRLVDALKKGDEVCETILNYRKDGSPFVNLLLLAPMKDNHGAVRYYLGAQIDVSSLIEGGKGVESFAQMLAEERDGGAKDPKQVLRNLSQMMTEEEFDVLRNRSAATATSGDSITSHNQRGSVRSSIASRPAPERTRTSRVVLGMGDDDDTPERKPLWPHASLGSSGRLPGVYQNYMLVRPYPSLRITFTSPALRIPGLLQTKLMDRVAGPPQVRSGLEEALAQGESGVTARVHWLSNMSSSSSGMDGGKVRFLHCTPLFDGNGKVGVWMVVMVEEERVTGSLNGGSQNGRVREGNGAAGGGDRMSSSGRMYADYLKEGKGGRPGTQETSSSAREARETFKDF